MWTLRFLLITSLALIFPMSQAAEKPVLVDINTASQYELMTLHGVGEKKAEAILKYRELHGLFQSTYEITEVYGIGDKLFEYNEPTMIVTFPKEETTVLPPLPELTTPKNTSSSTASKKTSETMRY